MSSVILKENETLDSALRRFKRSCAKRPERENITDLAADLRTESSLISIRELFLQGTQSGLLRWMYGSIDH